jgi:HPt (histidine-containing phosphotransfer) domain-containing protein
MAIEIDGINEKRILDLFEGDMGLYRAVLHAFIASAPTALNKLRNVSRGTLEDYAEDIQNIKDSATRICAEEAKKAASELEKMAKDGNLSGVLHANEAFLEYMETLLDNLQKWLNSQS